MGHGTLPAVGRAFRVEAHGRLALLALAEPLRRGASCRPRAAQRLLRVDRTAQTCRVREQARTQCRLGSRGLRLHRLNFPDEGSDCIRHRL